MVLYNCDGEGFVTIPSPLLSLPGAGAEISKTDSANIANINPMRYRRLYYDAETELYYLQSRYYSPEQMRFISQDDSALSNAQGEPLGSNLYVYCLNNPVMNIDKTGSYTIASLKKNLGYLNWHLCLVLTCS